MQSASHQVCICTEKSLYGHNIQTTHVKIKSDPRMDPWGTPAITFSPHTPQNGGSKHGNTGSKRNEEVGITEVKLSQRSSALRKSILNL